MIINQLDMKKAKTLFANMVELNVFKPQYSDENPDLRELLNKINHLWKNEAKEKAPYQADLIYGKELYSYLSNCEWFTDDVASNKAFWRYLALCTMPQVIYERFAKLDQSGNLKSKALSEHFYGKWERVYPFTLYWYFRICDQGTVEKTYDFLLSPAFMADTILNVVERMGPKGFRIDIYRSILEKYSKLDHSKYSKRFGGTNYILRALLVEHGIKNSVFIPELCDGGVNGYVDMVFKSTLGDDYV